MVIAPEQIPQLSADELRQVVTDLLHTVAANEGVLQKQAQALAFKQTLIDKLTFENAYLKRLKFAAQSERYSAEQRSLLDETLDADLQAVNDEIEQLQSDDATQAKAKQQPKRQVLPANLPRTDIHHEPDSTTCACGCQLKRRGWSNSTTIPRSSVSSDSIASATSRIGSMQQSCSSLKASHSSRVRERKIAATSAQASVTEAQVVAS